MRVNFLHRHVLNIVLILEEETLPHLQCIQCNMLIPQWELNGRPPATSQCARGAERKRRRLAEEELRESSESDFEAHGEPLEM